MTERAWSLLTTTRGGVVSVLRDLTKDECQQAYHRLNPRYGIIYRSYVYRANGAAMQQTERDFAVLVGGELEGDACMSVREVFGPPDWDRSEVAQWDKPWPKYERVEMDDPRNHWPAEWERQRAGKVA